MTAHVPWPARQDDVVRKHYMLVGDELRALVNAVGPTRTASAIASRRIILDVRKAPHPSGSKLQMQAIAARIAALHGLTVDDLKGESRVRGVFVARQEAMAEIYATGNFSYPTIGKFFGGRDHTTAMSAVKKYRALAQQEAA